MSNFIESFESLKIEEAERDKEIEELKQALNKPVPIDTRPISKDEFLQMIQQFRGDPAFSALPLPAFCYEQMPEFKNTEKERLNENFEYQKKQINAKDDNERLNNMKDRLRRKLEQKRKQIQ